MNQPQFRQLSWHPSKRNLYLTTVFFSSFVLSSCGTFTLARVQAPPGTTAEQQQSDILYCKDQAALAVSTAGRQTEDFLLGATLIGAPFAYEHDKATQRDVFANCMQSKSYTIVAGSEGTTGATTSAGIKRTAYSQPPPADTPSVPDIEKIQLPLPTSFEDRPIASELRRAGTLKIAIDRTADVGVSLMAEIHAGVSDVGALAVSRRGMQMSRLQDAGSSDVTNIEIGGHKAYRFEVHGRVNDLRLTYLLTMIEGQEQLVTINTWTSTANFDVQSNLMRGLAERVTGIE